MSNVNSQDIRTMQAADRAYGDRSDKKIVVQKDKSQKNRPNFSRMSLQDIRGMQEDDEDDDYEYEEGYETN